MAFQFRAQSATATGTTSLVIDAPAATALNDLLIACFCHKGSTYATLPASWTSAVQQISGTIRVEMAWKRATGAEPANYTFTDLTTSDTAIGVILGYTGGITSGSMVNVSTSRANLANAEGCASITTTVAGALLIACNGSSDDVGSGGTNYLLQDPSGIGSVSMLTKLNATSTTGSDCSLGVCDRIQTVPSATGAVLPSNISVTNVGMLVAFVPAVESFTTVNRFYLTSKSVGTRLLGLPLGNYPQARPQNRGLHHWPFLMDPSKSGGGISQDGGFGSGTLNTIGEIMFAERWVSVPLAAQTVSGTFDLCMKVAIPSGVGAAGAYHLYGYITVGDSYTERAVIINDVTDSVVWTTTETWRSLNAAITLTSGVALAGDRICLEVSAVTSPATAPPGDSSFRLGWGTTDNANVPVADATSGATTAQMAAWVNFGTAITIQSGVTPASPSNVSCLTATPISVLPYDAGPVDVTQSTGVHRSVWYTWTNGATAQRIFVSTFAANYSTKIMVWSGTCAGLSLVNVAFDLNAAQGNAQSLAWFDASASTQYWFQIDQPGQVSRAPYDPTDGGGSFKIQVRASSAPADGDVYVNGEHIIALRGSTLVNGTPDYYGQVPSGTAIDYSKTTITDQNGGTNSEERLIVGMFLDGGSGNTIHFLDLPTLNLGESSVNFQDGTAYNGGNAMIQSIYVDASVNPPRLVTGWDGDDYSWIGSASGAAAMRIRRALVTNNAAPGPQTAAEAFTVTQDVMGSAYVDVTLNGEIVRYTSSGTKIFSFNLATNTQLATFATIPNAVGPRPGLRMLRFLSPYTSAASMLVTNGTNIIRVDSGGNIAQTYTPSQSDYFQDIDKLALSSDGGSAYFGDALSMAVGRFNLTTGVEDFFYETNLPPGQMSGISVYGFRGTPVIYPTFETEDVPRRWLRRTSIISSENRRISHQYLNIDFEAGVGLASGDEEDMKPQVMMEFSSDGGKTFGNQLWRTIGMVGQYLARAQWWRLGYPRNRVYQVSGSAAVKTVITDAYIQAEGGDDPPRS